MAVHFVPCFIHSKQTANAKCITSCKLEDTLLEKSDQRQGVSNTDRQGFYELDIDKIIIVLYQGAKKKLQSSKMKRFSP